MRSRSATTSTGTGAGTATSFIRAWLEAAHLAFTRNLAMTSWIHTESTYQHHAALVAPDTAVSVRSRVRDATVRKGRDELALDVQIVDAVTGNVLVTVDHRAIVRLP